MVLNEGNLPRGLTREHLKRKHSVRSYKDNESPLISKGSNKKAETFSRLCLFVGNSLKISNQFSSQCLFIILANLLFLKL